MDIFELAMMRALVPSEEKVFDLVEMGLPALTENAQIVRASADTSEIMDAASKGTIKVKLNIMGVDGVFVLNLNYLEQMNIYQGTTIVIYNAIITIYVAISSTGLEAGMYATAL